MASSIMIVSFLTLLNFIYNEVSTVKKTIWQKSHTQMVTGFPLMVLVFVPW